MQVGIASIVPKKRISHNSRDKGLVVAIRLGMLHPVATTKKLNQGETQWKIRLRRGRVLFNLDSTGSSLCWRPADYPSPDGWTGLPGQKKKQVELSFTQQFVYGKKKIPFNASGHGSLEWLHDVTYGTLRLFCRWEGAAQVSRDVLWAVG